MTRLTSRPSPVASVVNPDTLSSTDAITRQGGGVLASQTRIRTREGLRVSDSEPPGLADTRQTRAQQAAVLSPHERRR